MYVSCVESGEDVYICTYNVYVCFFPFLYTYGGSEKEILCSSPMCLSSPRVRFLSDPFSLTLINVPFLPLRTINNTSLVLWEISSQHMLFHVCMYANVCTKYTYIYVCHVSCAFPPALYPSSLFDTRKHSFCSPFPPLSFRKCRML